MKLHHFFGKIHVVASVVAGMSIMLSACTTQLPVQEMSNARQTLRAAHLVDAKQYAPELFNKAESLLKAAENQLSEGEYAQARAYAVAAKQEAIRARQKALSNK